MSRSIFFSKSFREAENVGFAGVVGSHVGPGEKCRSAGDIDESGVREFEEDGDESLAQIGQNSDVEVDQSELAIRWD